MSISLVIGEKRKEFWHSFAISEELVLNNFINTCMTENLNECLSFEVKDPIIYSNIGK
jgi:hypothetical protein